MPSPPSVPEFAPLIANGLHFAFMGVICIELMIVVAILAIIAAIALPSYNRHVEKARRADAQSALLSGAQALERCFTRNNAYNVAACTVPAFSADGFYTITMATTPSTFILTATATGTDACSPFTLDHLGIRGSGGSNADRCWGS